MAPPYDSKQVLNAFRLGWHVAEVRGRNRPNGPKGTAEKLPDGDHHALPLRIERTATERRIEAQGVLAALAMDLGVDDDGQGGSYGDRIDQHARQLAKIRAQKNPPVEPSPQWTTVAELLWDLDAHVQDGLTAVSELQACGYQLGRGLAETYWALDPTQNTGPRGWTFLLGEPRCTELSRLVGRLSAYMNTYTAPAVAGSIEVWKNFANNDQPDRSQAQEALRNQTRRWYELIVLGQDSTTLIKPYDAIRNYRTLGQALRQFWPQIATTILGLGFLAAFLILLTVGGANDLVKTLSGITAAAGLALGAITGALKNSAQALLTRLKQDTYTELVTRSVTIAPPAMSKLDLRRAMDQRRLTPTTQL
ncbi:MAG TPA: hypothetical protein VGL06_30040 [Pseudonocardiaceae bacterium]